jgi:hypothetical protein
MLEIGYGRDNVTLSEETERNREDKHQPVATTPVSYSTNGQDWPPGHAESKRKEFVICHFVCHFERIDPIKATLKPL